MKVKDAMHKGVDWVTRYRALDHTSDEMRAVVESEWPELAHKLPPQKPQG
jgi:hypothetical protein